MIRQRARRHILFAAICALALGARDLSSTRVNAMSNQAAPNPLLYQTWLHSHEEDTTTETIYRVSSYAFPPSRGRMGFTLNGDGTCVWIGISPRDGSDRQSCKWSFTDGDQGEIALTLPNGERKQMRIASLRPDRLAIAK